MLLEKAVEQRRGVLLRFDNGVTLRVTKELFLSADLAVGKSITDSDFERINEAALFEHAFAYGLRVLTRAARSEFQVRRRLTAKGYDEALVDAVISRLLEMQFLDDIHYAKLLVDHYRGKMRSTKEIIFRLRLAHIDSDIIDDVMSTSRSAAEREALDAMIRKHYRFYEHGDLEKLQRMLARKGFSLSLIKTAIADYRASLASGENA
ncbi:MAG: regulatory protein RecX [Spirochaetes bacterium]|nr:regulatory protein RecX [Spirochaetota bacterium]